MIKHFILATLLSVVSMVTFAEEQQTMENDQLNWRDPAHIWHSTCVYCHGVGTGLAVELLGKNLPPLFIKTFVRQGAAGMPVFRDSEINSGELEALAKWIARSDRFLKIEEKTNEVSP